MPKSSRATRTPAFRRATSCWMTWQSSSKKTLSVTSRTSCRGSTPQDSVTASTSSAKSPCCSCTPDTLTASGPDGVLREPGLHLGAAREQYLGADLNDQAAALRHRDELLRGHELAVPLPAGQRLHLDDGAVPGREDRLIVHRDLAAVDGQPQSGFHLGALHEGRHHLRPEPQVPVLAGGLGRVHGDVGPAQQLGGVHSVLADGGQSQAEAGPQHGPVDPERHFQGLHDAFGDGLGIQ